VSGFFTRLNEFEITLLVIGRTSLKPLVYLKLVLFLHCCAQDVVTIISLIGDVQMLKKWTLGIILLSTSLFSQATLINSAVEAVDMDGITVTAFFADNSQETQIWSALTSTIAGVDNGDWSLMLEGNTFGDFDQATNTLYGLWTLTNIAVNQDIVGLTIDAGIEGFYFDILSGTLLSTPGSEAGREFVASDDTVTATFDDVFSEPDLYGTLNIAWNPNNTLATGQALSFLTDTDKAEIPEPSTMFSFALGLIALTSLRRKSSGK